MQGLLGLVLVKGRVRAGGRLQGVGIEASHTTAPPHNAPTRLLEGLLAALQVKAAIPPPRAG